MPKLLLALAALLAPAAALAADDAPPPPDEVPVAEPAPVEAPVEAPIDAPAVAPPAAAPVAAPDPCAGAQRDPCGGSSGSDPCGGWKHHSCWSGAEDPGCAHARWGSHRGHLAIGIAKGHIDGDDDREGSQRSLIARLTGRRGWAIELELSKLKLGDDDGKLAGGAILKAFGRHKLAPYVVAGAGGGKLDRADGSEAHLRFAEFGGGLMLRGRRLSIGAELRRGVRHVEADEAPVAMDPVAGRVMSSTGDDARYTRGRIVALVHF